MEGFRETMGGFPAAFAPFVPVQMAYISRLYRKASYNEERKKSLPIIRSRYQKGGTTSSVSVPETASPLGEANAALCSMREFRLTYQLFEV